MTHRGPFQPRTFCDSVILWLKHFHAPRCFWKPISCLAALPNAFWNWCTSSSTLHPPETGDMCALVNEGVETAPTPLITLWYCQNGATFITDESWECCHLSLALLLPGTCRFPRLLPSTVPAFPLRLRSSSSLTQGGPDMLLTRTKRMRASLWSEPRSSQIPSREPSTRDRTSTRYSSVCSAGGPLACSWAFIIRPADTSRCLITQTFREGRAEVHQALFWVVMLLGWEAMRNPPNICKNAHRAPKIYCTHGTQPRCLTWNILRVIIQRR